MAKVSVVTCDKCGKTVGPGEGFEVRTASYAILTAQERAAMPKRGRRASVRMIHQDLCVPCTEERMGID